MEDLEMKQIAIELKEDIEREYAEELMSGVDMNVEYLIESHINDYEDENDIELTDEEYTKLSERIECMLDIETIREDVGEAKYIQKHGMLSYLGMSEKDFL